MSRKLPRTIGRTIDDMRREAGSEAGARSVRSADERTPAAPAPATELAVVGPRDAAPKPPEPPLTLVPVSDAADSERLVRRLRGREIVARHATYAAVGGLIPLPIANIAGLAAIITHMASALAGLYGVPVQRDRTRAIVMGVLGGAAPVGLGAITGFSLMRYVPGANLVGLAVTSVTAAACTRSVGLLFLEHFESGGTLLDFSAKADVARATATTGGKPTG